MLNRKQKCQSLLSGHQIEALLITNPINVRYLTGFTGTAGVALIMENKALFFTDFRYVDQANEQVQGFDIIEHSQTMNQDIQAALQQHQVKRLGFEASHVSYATYQKYKEAWNSCELVPITELVEQLRYVKDHAEIELIRQAVDIADRTYAYILDFVQPGLTEIEVANELEFHMRKLGATCSSFDMIVASGNRSAMPHGVASHKVIEKGDVITLDFGAIYKGYVSDMTRTFALGEPDQRLKDIYNICLQAQLHGVEQAKAGMTGQEVDALCRDYITEHGYGDHFGHSTGHGIGLEVHEGPGLSKKSKVELQAGMVVTIEPGIYVSGLGGVRIEDDIVITNTGNDILTQSTKELLIIEN